MKKCISRMGGAKRKVSIEWGEYFWKEGALKNNFLKQNGGTPSKGRMSF